MRKSVKIIGGVLIGIVVLIGGWFVAAFVSVMRNSLPGNSARVVETADYRFDASDGWNTACADRAPGCLAVAAKNQLWNDREHWIEVQAIDSKDIADSNTFTQRSYAIAASIVTSNGGKSEALLQAGDSPVSFEGTELLDLRDTTASRYSISRFVRLPDGRELRFTCYGEQELSAQEHDDACLGGMGGLHFPAAAAVEEKRLAEEQAQRELEQQRALEQQRQLEQEQVLAQQRRRKADDHDDASFDYAGTASSSDPNSMWDMKNVTKTWEKVKPVLKAPEKQQAVTSQPQQH